jgi:hypothetical protein
MDSRMLLATTKRCQLIIDQGHHTTTNWSRRMQEREEREEGIRLGMAVKAMRWVG